MIQTEKATKSKYIMLYIVTNRRQNNICEKDFCQMQGGIYQFHENCYNIALKNDPLCIFYEQKTSSQSTPKRRFNLIITSKMGARGVLKKIALCKKDNFLV